MRWRDLGVIDWLSSSLHAFKVNYVMTPAACHTCIRFVLKVIKTLAADLIKHVYNLGFMFLYEV